MSPVARADKKFTQMLEYFNRVPRGQSVQSQGTCQFMFPHTASPGTTLEQRIRAWAEPKGLTVTETDVGWRFEKK